MNVARFLGDEIHGTVVTGEVDSFMHIINKDTEKIAFGTSDISAKTQCNIIKSGMVDAYHYLSTSLRVILTIFVSTSSGERSLSKLKLIKDFVKSRMSQQRFNLLELVCTEAEVSGELAYNLLTGDIAKQ